jgi:hypothetical protein
VWLIKFQLSFSVFSLIEAWFLLLFFISSLSRTIHSFILFMAYQFGLLFLVTWFLSNSNLFRSFFFLCVLHFSSLSILSLFWFSYFFCICFLKNNVIFNSIRKVIKNYKMDVLMDEMRQKHIFEFWFFEKTLKITKWTQMCRKYIFEFMIFSRRHQ